jgi:primosomal protein DnaI
VESLSDLLRGMPGNWRSKVEEQARRVLADPEVAKFTAKHPELGEAILKQNVPKLHQYAVEYRNCTACPGLSACPNDFPGHYTKLTVGMTDSGAVLYDAKVPCKKQLAHERQEMIRNKIRSFHADYAGLSEEYSLAEMMDRDPDREAAVHRIVQYIDRTEKEGLQKKGLYLVGKLGTGKTYLAGYVLQELAKSGFSGAIVYMPEFVEDLKNMIGDGERLAETLEALKNADLLVLDDIGAENLSPWVRDHVLGSILNYRMNRKPTVFTSNHTLDELEKHFSFTSRDGEEEYKGQRLMDRIRPYVEVVEVLGRNMRGA